MSEDNRPRIHGKAATTIGEITLTVQGSPDENSDDIEETFDHALEELMNTQCALAEDDDPKVGVE